MAFVAISAYTLISDGSAVKDRITADDREFLRVHTALGRIERDLLQIYSPLYYSFREEAQTEGRGQNTAPRPRRPRIRPHTTRSFPSATHDGRRIPIVSNMEKGHLTFFTASNRRKVQDNKESRYQWVSYSLENNPDTEKRADSLVMRYSKPLDPYPEDVLQNEGFTAQRVLANVSSLQFLFWDTGRKDFVERSSDVAQDVHLVRAVKVLLTWVAPSGEERIFERVFRPLFPFFDTKKDQEEIKKVHEERRKKRGQRSRPPPQNPNAPPPPQAGGQMAPAPPQGGRP